MSTTNVDLSALHSLEEKQRLVRDHVAGVVRRFKNGLFLYGEGGVGKSYVVLQKLKELDANYRLHNSRMTAKGLFLVMSREPDSIFVLEDMERITKDPDAQGILRSAMWSQPGHDRVVTWTTARGGVERFVFSGGLIMLSNRPLADMPELHALGTRIEVCRFDATNREVEALMREVATRGFWKHDKMVIDRDTCLDVTEFLLAESHAAGCRIDLRLQQKAFETYLQWEGDWCDCHWHDLVTASVREATHHFRHDLDVAPREDRIDRRRRILREILSRPVSIKEQERLYCESTGKSRADFFRRKREIDSREFD